MRRVCSGLRRMSQKFRRVRCADQSLFDTNQKRSAQRTLRARPPALTARVGMASGTGRSSTTCPCYPAVGPSLAWWVRIPTRAATRCPSDNRTNTRALALGALILHRRAMRASIRASHSSTPPSSHQLWLGPPAMSSRNCARSDFCLASSASISALRCSTPVGSAAAGSS
jgi:hypothetical protein